MTVEDKIQESEYFIQQIGEAYSNQKEVEHNFSAFLSASRSIPEHLLEYYNQKYNVGISSAEKMNTSEFKKRCRGNTKAENFIDWFGNEINKINQDPVGNFLWNKRNMNIHRITQRPDHVVFTVNDTVQLSDVVKVREFPVDMTAEEALRIINEESKQEQPSTPIDLSTSTITPTNSTIDWRFQELPSLNIIKVCTQFLNLMKNLVTDAKTNFL